MLFITLTTTAFAGMLFGSITTRTQSSHQTNHLGGDTNIVGDSSDGEMSQARVQDSNISSSNSLILGQTDTFNTLEVASSAGSPRSVLNNQISNPDDDISPTQAWINPPPNSAINIRTQPNLNAEVLTRIINPSPTNIIDDSHPDWTQITFTKNGQKLTGWIFSDLLSSDNIE